MICRGLSALEVLCELCILESVVLKCHPVLVSLLLRRAGHLGLLDLFRPVIRFFNDLKLDGGRGIADPVQLDLAEKKSDFSSVW